MGMALQIEGLTVRSDRGRVLLDVEALTVAPGAAIGVRGPSGAGKSTLLYALAGLADRVEGRLCWGETDLASARITQRAAFRAAHIGMIFQDFLLFEELGPLANAALPAMFAPKAERSGIRAGAEKHLARLGIGDEARTVATFSGGERQRVAVARAFAGDPDILLADEPTASLHREAADALIADLCELARSEGRTLITVSHDAALLERMDRVLTLRDGRLEPSQ